ncbi:MAG TPA: copper resistance CopC family protein [Gemmatimonadales bacterium]|jgi:methionine-rich copper-binding protein CopC
MFKLLLSVAALAAVTGVMRHAGLKSSMPAKGAMLSESPKVISLTFTEGVLLPATSIAILKADSTVLEKLVVKAVAGDTTVAGALKTPLPKGTYIVKWRNGAKDDGHPSSGTFSFMVMGH